MPSNSVCGGDKCSALQIVRKMFLDVDKCSALQIVRKMFLDVDTTLAEWVQELHRDNWRLRAERDKLAQQLEANEAYSRQLATTVTELSCGGTAEEARLQERCDEGRTTND